MRKGFKVEVRILGELCQVEVFETRWQADQFAAAALANLSHQRCTADVIDETAAPAEVRGGYVHCPMGHPPVENGAPCVPCLDEYLASTPWNDQDC